MSIEPLDKPATDVPSATPTRTPASVPARDTVLDVQNFSVDYGTGAAMVRAVNNVSFTLQRSTVLGVAGESGSGKSTLVYAMTRLLREPGIISGGAVNLHVTSKDKASEDVLDLVQANEKQLRAIRWSHVSIVLQSALSAMDPVRRVGKEFNEVLKTHRPDMSKSERLERAKALVAMVGLNEDRLDRFPHELSGGQRQRVMIALALALEPELVIMDEPTTALDVVTQREIINELLDLRTQLNFAMIFITHDLSLLVELADEIVVMYAGRIVERARADELYEAPRHPYTLGLLNSFPPMSGARRELVGIPGAPPDLADLPVGCTFQQRCPYVMDHCRREEPPLSTLPGTRRQVACWLHDGGPGVRVPGELTRQVRASTLSGGPNE
jgi:peptide/nickel transport system ATP-binding protein